MFNKYLSGECNERLGLCSGTISREGNFLIIKILLKKTIFSDFITSSPGLTATSLPLNHLDV